MSDFYITSNKALQEIVDLARAKKTIALDTEFTRERTYYPILSLVQVAIDKKVFVVDCLADVDLQPLYNIIADTEIKKILHSSAQDLQIFHQQSQKAPVNVADVQLMANFCGLGFNVGYSNLVEQLFQISVDKKMQCSDWQQRPLNARQIEYAMLDVTYLEEIHAKLSEDLRQKKRDKWFLEEIENFVPKVLTKDENVLFKNFSAQKKFGRKDPRQIAKIRGLILWREKVAQALDVPRRHFLDDDALEEIVMLEKFHHKIDNKMRREIEEILLDCEKQEHPLQAEERNNVMSEKQKAKYQRAKDLIERVALGENIREQFLMTSSDLKEVILGNKNLENLVAGWRYFLFGRDLQKIINS